ncbi:hypothetical protein FB45DRAFT_1078922 [Roridomyces roridus]|uniref:Uncharacterized protein n=1 Tax=Roridomyces roridus TaxID=1738132 RepID=A0AAD7CL34_9AGAR|nr:hypothetical protein FB45DRAFT_1078922 [Roridomyces roridus]
MPARATRETAVRGRGRGSLSRGRVLVTLPRDMSGNTTSGLNRGRGSGASTRGDSDTRDTGAKPRGAALTLAIPELLDLILGFLHNTKDLRACALVNHSWVSPSQSRIFSHVDIMRVDYNDESFPRVPGRYAGRFSKPNAQLARLVVALNRSPYLIPLIVTLSTESLWHAKPDSLKAFCAIPFTRLTTLRIHVSLAFSFTYSEAEAVQKLLNFPTIVSVSIKCLFAEAVDFLRMWEGCSESIKHVSFSCGVEFPVPGSGSERDRNLGDHTRRRIKLDSFGTSDISGNVQNWLQHPLCPFDISDITALQPTFSEGRPDPGSYVLAQVRESIQLLSITQYSRKIRIKWFIRRSMHQIETYPKCSPFAYFPQVTQLDVRGVNQYSLLRDIPRVTQARIRAIRFTSSFEQPETELSALDQLLFEVQKYFPNLTVVEIRVLADLPELERRRREYFGRLEPRVAVRWNFERKTPVCWLARLRTCSGWNPATINQTASEISSVSADMCVSPEQLLTELFLDTVVISAVLDGRRPSRPPACSGTQRLTSFGRSFENAGMETPDGGPSRRAIAGRIKRGFRQGEPRLGYNTGQMNSLPDPLHEFGVVPVNFFGGGSWPPSSSSSSMRLRLWDDAGGLEYS